MEIGAKENKLIETYCTIGANTVPLNEIQEGMLSV
jgi:hypothetical protein